ncbi:MAG: hypothetical protein IJ349_05350 [Clostridia bacterium]|nr:hypothetical protein [Clostridia bacterium]
MFTIESDGTINITRGDVLYFGVSAKDRESEEKYIFQPSDIVRISVYGKKECENVVMQKDFAVTTPSEDVEIYLDKEDTKIGEVINKPTDYWYEIVLNPDTKPQTIMGYDEDGAKIFRLYPEGGKPDLDEEPATPENPREVDEELDPLSKRPIENGAVARAFLAMLDKINALEAEVTQLKGEEL